MVDFSHLLAKLGDGNVLSAPEASAYFEAIFKGDVAPVPLAASLMALKVRGETPTEILAGAQSLRAHAVRFPHDFDVIDTCGTGGDGAHTFNISTTVAFVLAGAGQKVAKHGGRASSSLSGSSDVLTALGVNIDYSIDRAQNALHEAGICFLFAPNHHAVMRHVAPVRKELGLRSIFNLLGPLSNPAFAQKQILGVYDRKWLRPMAEVLKALGLKAAWVVHGHQGLDEVALSGPTEVCALKDGQLTEFTITPADFDMTTAPLDALKGGDPAHNAKALCGLLMGEKGPYRDSVVLNAACALMMADTAHDFASARIAAEASIDSGKALLALDRLVQISHS